MEEFVETSNINPTNATAGEVKKRKAYSNSRANTKRFAQQRERKPSCRKVPDTFADSDALTTLNRLGVKCRKKGGQGCILNHFTDGAGKIDYNSAVLLLKYCFSMVCNKDDDELFAFLAEQYRASRTGTTICSTGKAVDQMDYRLGATRNVKTCRKCFATAFCCTVNDIEIVSSNMKLSSNGRINTSRIRTFEDDSILNNTYDDVDRIFFENVGRFMDNTSTGMCSNHVSCSHVTIFSRYYYRSGNDQSCIDTLLLSSAIL